MTPERLQELIDKCGAVWTSINGGYWFKLNPKQYKIVVTDKHPYYDDGTVLLCYKKFEEPSGYDIDYELTDLREDIDRAKWERDMTAEQVVKFNPPMWEDIKEYYQFDWLDKNFDMFYFEVIDERDLILVGKINGENLFEGKATEKDYIKACKIVINLLKGDED